MLYILLSVLIVFPVLMGFGHLFQRIFGRIWNGISSLLISGIIFLILSWQIIAFFHPIDIYVEVISIGIGLCLNLYFKSYKTIKFLSLKDWGLWGCCSLIVFFIASSCPFSMDHFGYYVPSIKWLSEYGLVKGISNLDWVLGQMSPWHIFQTGFSHLSDSYLKINAIFLSIFFIYIIERKIWLMFCFTPILFFLVHSPSPDLPSIIISLIILNEILCKNQQYHLLLGLSVLAFSIKPTIIWLPIFSFFYPILNTKKFHFSYLNLGIFIGLLYILKNIWVFGYPFFPISLFDFDLPWKPYGGLFELSAKYAKITAFGLQYSIEEISSFSSLDYILNWLFLDGVKGVINISFIISLFILGICVFTIRRDKIYILLFISILIKSILVLSFSAQYRFFMEVFFVVFFIIFKGLFNKKYSILGFTIFAFIVGTWLLFPQTLRYVVPSFRLGGIMRKVEINQIYRPSYYQSQSYTSHQLNNFKFNVPTNYALGFDAPLPVLTIDQLIEFYYLGIFPKMRGETLKDGFVWKKLEEREKIQLRIIIEKIKK